MPEPLFMSAAAATAMHDAYTRAVSRALGVPGRHEFNVLTSGVQRIEQAINAQNSAHFTAAKMALARNNIPLALDKMESGLAADPINAKGWLLYADLLMSQNHRDLAKQVIAQCAEWFGPHCPALPQEVRDIYLSQDKVQGNLKAIVQPPDSSWEMRWCGLSKRGAAFAYDRLNWFTWQSNKVNIIFAPALKYDGIDTSVLKKDPAIVFPKPLTIFSKDPYSAYNLGRIFTDRFMVIGNIAIDTLEDFRHISVSDEKIKENFGTERYGCDEWSSRYGSVYDPVGPQERVLNVRGVRMRLDTTLDHGMTFEI